MALANVAVLLAQWGYRTLIVDWDLEAPGLEYFFRDYLDVEVIARRHGLVDCLSSVMAGDPRPSEVPNWQSSVISIAVPNVRGTLNLLTAGLRENSPEYFARVRDFDARTFYKEKRG